MSTQQTIFTLYLLCASSAFSISEFMIDTKRFYGASPGLQFYPEVVFDGMNYFVVWDQAVLMPGDISYTSDGIYGARINQNGMVLDSVNIPIAIGNYRWPDVSFDSTNYLVIWEKDSAVYGSRITTEGIILDPNGIRISHSEGYWFPVVAFNGTNYLIVWKGRTGGLYGVRISPLFEILDTADIFICAAPAVIKPAICSDGRDYFVVWSGDYTPINGIKINNQGIPSSPIIISPDNNNKNPSVNFDGTNYLVVWEKFIDNNWGTDIYGRRVSAEGIVIDPADKQISHLNTCEWRPEICFNGTRYLIVYYINIKQTSNYSAYDIYGSFVTPDFTVTAPFAICTVLEDQSEPVITSNNDEYYVVWQDERSGPNEIDIYGSRVSASGNILDPGVLFYPPA